jgi:timeless
MNTLIDHFLLLELSDNLKDLLRFLRRDDPQTRDVFKQVCRWNIVSKDLVPIIEHYHEDRSTLLNAGSCF